MWCPAGMGATYPCCREDRKAAGRHYDRSPIGLKEAGGSGGVGQRPPSFVTAAPHFGVSPLGWWQRKELKQDNAEEADPCPRVRCGTGS